MKLKFKLQLIKFEFKLQLIKFEFKSFLYASVDLFAADYANASAGMRIYKYIHTWGNWKSTLLSVCETRSNEKEFGLRF